MANVKRQPPAPVSSGRVVQMKGSREQLTVLFDLGVVDEIDRLADEMEMSRGAIIRLAVKQFLARQKEKT